MWERVRANLYDIKYYSVNEKSRRHILIVDGGLKSLEIHLHKQLYLWLSLCVLDNCTLMGWCIGYQNKCYLTNIIKLNT